MEIRKILRFFLIIITTTAAISFYLVNLNQAPYTKVIISKLQADPLINNLSKFTPSTYLPTSELTRYPDSDLSLSCIPVSEGVSDNEYYTHTKNKLYSACKKPTKDEYYADNGTIYAHCDDLGMNAYALETEKPEILGSDDLEVKWKKFDGSEEISIKNSQYVFVKCARKSIFTQVFHHFSEKISSEAQNTRKSIESQHNLTSTRPLTINILLFDSLSRQNLFRFLPKTTEFLKSSFPKGNLSTSFSLFDFSLSHTIGSRTLSNIIPILYGDSYDSISNELSSMNPLNSSTSDSFENLQRKLSIWTYLKSLGYVTLFGYDTIHDFLSSVTGKKIFVDFAMLNFWKAANRVYGYNDFAENQRCLGEKNAHWFMLEYSMQFMKNYEGHHRFIYNHLSPGHESTGVIRTADEDLVEYLANVLDYYKQKSSSEDFVMMILSDHGRLIGKLEFSVDHFIENKIPLTMIIANNDFLQRTGSGKILEINTRRLISRYDLHLTLKTLGLSPYGKPAAFFYKTLQESYPIPSATSLIISEVSKTRTCISIGSNHIECICNSFIQANLSDPLEQLLFTKIQYLSLTITNQFSLRYKDCESFTYYEPSSFLVFPLRLSSDGDSRKYKLTLNTHNLILEIIAHFSTINQIIKTKARVDDLNLSKPSETFEFDNITYYIQVIEVNIIQSLCDRPEDCLCSSPWQLFDSADTCTSTCLLHHLECEKRSLLPNYNCEGFPKKCICI